VLPVVLVTEYVMPVALGQTGEGPVMAEVTGVELMDTVVLTGVPIPQGDVSVTLIVPGVVPKLTVIIFVPCPDVILDPAGTVQLYVSPIVLVTEYVIPVAFGHTETGPVIAEVIGVELAVIVNELGVPIPHEVDSLTVITPPVAPKLAVIALVPCPDAILTPDEAVHV
jgi:hypothetical protein